METIFDYNPTDEELQRFGGREHFEWYKKIGFEPFSHPDDANYALGLLFSMRGNRNKANWYWAKIQNKEILSTLVEDF